ncbi:PilZ domain-containing protein [Pseudoalteromonas phenolica]|uniref:PilZ domain-containing protein n=1 Tax=Pseudoalteromonas phenolica TaxID=161398 RepID=A0A4Q7IQG5_9GAMM|nr:PilZ domain-containing protein [Pseudoalteromonas phenolica]RZQ54122.1 PilZ domain-containing protein [Pseudoalteromonas phenolica]
MAEDKLQQYQPLIEELKQELGTPGFDQFFAQKTVQLSKSDQFLLKMEMSRLSQPIARFIDLRGQVAGEVKPYIYEGKQHFMDDLAIAVFEQEIVKHGKYTLAVYEAVMHTDNNFRVMQKRAQQKDEEDDAPVVVSNHGAKLIKFASYESRIEERMNYAIKITVEVSRNNIISASTSDISLSGAKIKVHPKAVFEKGQLLTIRLVGLEQDFELGLKSGIQYEVVAVEPVSREYQHVRLKRTFVENNPGFDEFLNSFIHGNKRRYKINLDNTMDAVVCKGYEQYYLPRVSSLFVFLNKVNDKLTLPSMVLTNENNAYIHYYFEDERKKSCLYSIFNQKRLAHLNSLPSAVKEAILYTFTHSDGSKIYYYSAFDYELTKEPELASLFFGFGAKKDSWRAFKVQIMPSYHEDAYIPLSLPSSAGKSLEKLNKRPTPRVQGFIQDVQNLMLLTDITDPRRTEIHKKNAFAQSQVNLLKHFGHGKANTPPYLEVVALEYVNLRAHKRYLYKTGAVFYVDTTTVIEGHTRDLSVMGLQIEVINPIDVKKGDLVHIDLPELQTITKKHNLKGLHYKVMAVSKSKTIINLKVHKLTENKHPAIEFFTQLIEKNKSKLQACEESPKVPGLSTALRNMITKSVCQFPLYLHKESAHFNIGAVGRGLYPTKLHKVLESFNQNNQEHIEISPVFPSKFIEDELSDALRKRTRQDKPLKYTLFLRFDPDKKTLSEAVKSQILKDEDSLDSLFLFIKKALRKEILFVFQLHVSKTGRPDTDYLANELKYVSHYALHKAKDLEEALWDVTGVCDLIDITDEVLPTLDIEANLVTGMAEKKRLWFESHTL